MGEQRRKIADLRAGDRVRNKQTGWTGTLTKDPMLRGKGNDKVKVCWDQNGHEGWTSLASMMIVPDS